MISHDRAQELISARMDAPLTPAEHQALQNHLATCAACHAFVLQADSIARDLQVLPLLPPSPMVSRAVMSAISSDTSGWTWLRPALQALSSPGMAVASSMALVLALAGALLVALNAPGGGNNPGQGVAPVETIGAVADVALPTEIPTEGPKPTASAANSTEAPAEPTATREARTIAPAPTSAPKTPTPRPTATRVPIVESADAPEQPVIESPPIQPADAPVYEEPISEQPELAMAPGAAQGDTGTADLAQVAEPPVDTTGVQESIEQPPVESEPVEQAPVDGEVALEAASAPEGDDSGQGKEGNKKDNGGKAASEEPADEPVPTRPIGPLPVEAIAALEGVNTPPDFSLPPAPLDPTLPDQSFLPVTPTPETNGTPTPESEQATESEAPQLAEEWSGDLGVAALAPEEPVLAEAPDSETSKSKKVKDKEKRDKASEAGKSHEQQQAAFAQGPLGWSSQPLVMQPPLDQSAAYLQTTGQPVAPEQPADYPVDASSTTGETAGTADAAGASTTETGAATAAEPEPQIDPATGMEIDPATGYLIDPTTGYLLDRVNGRVIDPRTSFEVHPGTGLLIDPATGAMLDPNTLAVVIPAGFGSDQPAYNPGDPAMRGNIETVVDDTYDSASIKMVPATDGPVQPVGEIVIPTETGDAVEIS